MGAFQELGFPLRQEQDQINILMRSYEGPAKRDIIVAVKPRNLSSHYTHYTLILYICQPRLEVVIVAHK